MNEGGPLTGFEMSTNVEIKARIRNSGRINALAEALTTAPSQVIEQEDSERKPERNRVDAMELDSIVDRASGEEISSVGTDRYEPVPPVKPDPIAFAANLGRRRVKLAGFTIWKFLKAAPNP